MTIDNDLDAFDRRRTIAGIISAELERQAREGAMRIDVNALAGAIDEGINPDEPFNSFMAEGRRPQDLNATNDD